ncbi:hypothetical protein QQF64_019819 [Cirrhinus molitorella]|uniref:Uncharacterized protein n=1 Tax=Cirrhinus molitorella TaxID=172907 RepID=A0ABR3LGR0_9TELE
MMIAETTSALSADERPFEGDPFKAFIEMKRPALEAVDILKRRAPALFSRSRGSTLYQIFWRRVAEANNGEREQTIYSVWKYTD